MSEYRGPNRLAQVAADGISAFIRGNAAFRTSLWIAVSVLAVVGMLALIKVLGLLTPLGNRPIP